MPTGICALSMGGGQAEYAVYFHEWIKKRPVPEGTGRKEKSMISAGMGAAAVIAAAAFVVMVVIVVVIAGSGGTGFERALGECFGALVRRAALTGVQTDARGGKRLLCAHADAAADQRFNAVSCQKARQQSVTASVGVDYFGGDDFTVFDYVDLELRSSAEMLEDSAVFIGCRDFHKQFILSSLWRGTGLRFDCSTFLEYVSRLCLNRSFGAAGRADASGDVVQGF